MLARMISRRRSRRTRNRFGTAVQPAKGSAQAVLNFMLSKLTPANAGDMYGDLLAYVGTGTWTGSDTQLQTRASGLAHLILGSAEYQLV
jgi:hypothetical protein